MKVHGKFHFKSLLKDIITLSPGLGEGVKFENILRSWTRTGHDTLYRVLIEFQAKIDSMGALTLSLHPIDTPDFIIETAYEKRTQKMNRTYWGILRFIFWAHEGRKPVGDETRIYDDAFLEMYAPMVYEPNPLKPGHTIARMKSHAEMTTVEFARLIDGALSVLSTEDIPRAVLEAIGGDMKTLWLQWYEQRRIVDKGLSALEPEGMTKEQYRKIHPVCELTGRMGTPIDPVERMHLVAGLEQTPYYEQPWSYIMALHSLHIEGQHQHGWESILKEFPHIREKWEYAQEKSGKLRGK